MGTPCVQQWMPEVASIGHIGSRLVSLIAVAKYIAYEWDQQWVEQSPVVIVALSNARSKSSLHPQSPFLLCLPCCCVIQLLTFLILHRNLILLKMDYTNLNGGIWRVAEHAGFDGLKFEHDVPVPQLGSRDCLVKIEAVSLNFRDLMVAQVHLHHE